MTGLVPEAGGHDWCTVGVDIGTYEAKGVLLTAAGEVAATATRAHDIVTAPGGRVEHDAESVWWQGLCAVVEPLVAHAHARGLRLAAAGISGIGPCVVPVDDHLRPLASAALYGVDTRATEEIELLEERLGREALRERCGNRLTSQSAGPKIMWLHRNRPQVHAAARWFLTCQSFLVARLTGEVVVDHLTAGYFHPLYDITALDWETGGCEDFIERERLPRLAWSSELAGTVTALAAQQTGLPEGLPVVVGTADAPAEAFSCGVTSPGQTMVMYGSSSFMLQVTDTPTTTGDAWVAPYLFPGTFLAAVGTATAGTLTRWLVDLLALDGTAEEAFAELDTLARESPAGADGLLALPYLNGERSPLHDPGAQGVLLGLTLRHGRPELSRAILEGIAHAMVAALRALADATGTLGELRSVGGGVHNTTWTQAVSDILGAPQTTYPSSGAARGSAHLAACLVRGDRIGHAAAAGPVVAADPGLRALYEEDHRRFHELYRATRPLLLSPIDQVTVSLT